MDQPLKVLVVDDEPFNVDYLVQELEDFGVESLTAFDGEEALQMVEEHDPDLILLDIMMPKLDGFGVLDQLKASESWRDIPVIVISAHSDMEHVLKGIEMGAEDYLPKPFDPLLLQARVNASLEKKRYRNMERQYLESIERELTTGRDIQAGFLPALIPKVKGWQIEAYFEAAREVSGDFYDVFELEKDQIGLMIGDVTDKGVGSALYMALYRSLLRASMLQSSTGDSVERLRNAVEITNRYICLNHEEPHFLTLFISILDPDTGSLSYLSAGHDHPLLIGAGGDVTEIKPTGPMIGFNEEAEFEVATLQLASRDCLLCYTDGVTDIRNETEQFGKERLLAYSAQPTENAKQVVGNLVSVIKQFAGEESQFDDITLLSLFRK